MATTIPASHADLADAPGVTTLTTIGADGYPQSTAIWFLRDGDVMRTSLTRGRQKTKNLTARPQGTLFFIDPANQFRTLEIRADVSFEDDPDAVFLDKVLSHYGVDPATFPAPREDRVIVTFAPTKVNVNG